MTEAVADAAREKYLRRAYAADSASGRLLLALRPGRMCLDQLQNRFGDTLGALRRKAERDGFISRMEGGYIALTESGRAACPQRAG